MARSLLLVALFPCAALASSVLVVPVNDDARNVKDNVNEALSAAKVTVKTAGPKAPASACVSEAASMRNSCLATAGRTANVDALLVLSVVNKRGALTVTMEMLSASDGSLIKKDVVRTTQAKWPNASAASLKKFVPALENAIKKAAAAALRPEPAPVATPVPIAVAPQPVAPAPVTPAPAPTPAPTPTSDRPATVSLTPEPITTLDVQAPPSRGGRFGAWATTIIAVGAAGTAGAFLGMGLSAKGKLEEAPMGISMLTHRDALALQNQANLNLTIALVTGITAAVSGVLAIVLWSLQ